MMTTPFGGLRTTLLLSSFLAIAGSVGCGAATQAVDHPDAGQDAGPDSGVDAGFSMAPITLVEVFGSEGCGKCPAADLSANPYATHGEDGLFSIEYHVSYSSPWHDVYASMTYDDLAGDYLNPILGPGSYTYGLPALFIDAKYVPSADYPYTKQFGSVSKTKVVPQAWITLSLRGASTANPLVVNYDVTFSDADGAPSSGMLGIAFVERGIVSDITSGDNAGINLHEENVARALSLVGAGNEAGFVKLTIPSDADRSNSSVIAFVKDSSYGNLYGASELDL